MAWGAHTLARMLGRLIALTSVAAVLVPAAADAASYKVVKAVHRSTSSKAEQGYTGSSTVTWKLAKGRSVLGLQGKGAQVTGIGTVKVTGAYSIDATTSFPGHCAWTARTGDEQYPGVAPEPFELLVAPDSRKPGRTSVSFTAARASLGNGYLGTECSTSLTGEPDRDDTQLRSVPLNTFRKKTVKLTFAGSTSEAGIAYAWSTRLVLKRVKR